MVTILAFAFTVICFFAVRQGYRIRWARWHPFAVICLFWIGYCILPIILRPFSVLDIRSDHDVAIALGMHGLFLICVLVGGMYGFYSFRFRHRLEFRFLDELLVRNSLGIFLGAAVLYVVLFGKYSVNAYTAENMQQYFLERDPLRTMAEILKGLALAVCAVLTALEGKDRHWMRPAIMFTFIGSAMILNIAMAQRLAIITPLAMMVCALFVLGQSRRAFGVGLVMVCALVMLSPLAVYLRNQSIALRGNEYRERSSSVGIAEQVSEAVQSIVDRADLLDNTILLKTYIDDNGFVGWQYYYSVFVSPVPSTLLKNKPVLLSADGTSQSQLSVIVWGITRNGMGSLTAFGAISAYSERGWVGVVMDGVLSGLLISAVTMWLGEGGMVARCIYVALFPLIAIKRVPPSVMEVVAEMAPIVPLVVVCFLVNAMFSRKKRLRKCTGSWQGSTGDQWMRI